MPLNFIFRQPKNELEKGGRTPGGRHLRRYGVGQAVPQLRQAYSTL